MTHDFDHAKVLPDESKDEAWDDEIDPIQQRKEARRRRALMGLAFMLTLVVGVGIGLFVMRQRYHTMKTIVSINGQTINEDGFVHRMEVASGPQTLKHMANEMLVNQYATKLGVVVTKAEVDARYRQVSSSPDFPQYMATTHQDPEDVANNIRLELTFNKVVGKNVTVTDADARNYYKGQTDKSNTQAKFYMPPRVTIQDITCRSNEQILKAKQELDKGIDFKTVVAKYSADVSSKDHGGELPPIIRGRTIYSRVKGLEAIIFDMRIGEQRGPLKFGSLWCIIRCLKQEPEVITPYEQVEYECHVGAMMSKLPASTLKNIHDDYIKFQQSASIHTFRPEYKMVFGGR